MTRGFYQSRFVFCTRKYAHQACRKEALHTQNDIIVLFSHSFDNAKQVEILVFALIPHPKRVDKRVIGKECMIGCFHHQIQSGIGKLMMQLLCKRCKKYHIANRSCLNEKDFFHIKTKTPLSSAEPLKRRCTLVVYQNYSTIKFQL